MATVKCTIGSVRGQNQRWEMGSVPAGGNVKGMTGRKMLRAGRRWSPGRRRPTWAGTWTGWRGSGDPGIRTEDPRCLANGLKTDEPERFVTSTETLRSGSSPPHASSLMDVSGLGRRGDGGRRGVSTSLVPRCCEPANYNMFPGGLSTSTANGEMLFYQDLASLQ